MGVLDGKDMADPTDVYWSLRLCELCLLDSG